MYEIYVDGKAHTSGSYAKCLGAYNTLAAKGKNIWFVTKGKNWDK